MDENQTDIIIVGAGLAGLVAATEAVNAGRKVIIVDQESQASLGGQAFWSFGGLFLVNTPEQRFLGIHDSHDLARQDWLGAANFDRHEDVWPRRWAEAYIDFAAGAKRPWLRGLGVRLLPVVGWAERGGCFASGHGNSVPRFHIALGTGPGILEPFIRCVKDAESKGQIRLCYRHRVTELICKNGCVQGIHGSVLETDDGQRGMPTSRKAVGEFSLQAQVVIIASGGMGANHALVRRYWPSRLGHPPKNMLSGVPDYVDGSLLTIAERAGAHLINLDRMWHYPEGIKNYAPIWSNHGIRILSGPTPLWLDAYGNRLPMPLYPGFDALGALGHICHSRHPHSWFLLNQHILQREFALSGSEQNPDITHKSKIGFLSRLLPRATQPVQSLYNRSGDFITANNLADLARSMNKLIGEELIDVEQLQNTVVERDRELASNFCKDAQLMAIRDMRRYIGDRLFRIVRLDRLLNPKHGPLLAVRLSVITRKTLGGIETNLSSEVLTKNGTPLPGLYAAGEVCGFGGGGMHGYRSLEGSFLGGCLFSGKIAGRSAADAII